MATVQANVWRLGRIFVSNGGNRFSTNRCG